MWTARGINKTRCFIDLPGQVHEFTFSCYGRLPLFVTDLSRGFVIDALQAARDAYQLALLAYVIMPEHVHLLFLSLQAATRTEDIAKSVKQSVARRALAQLRGTDPDWVETHLAGEWAGTRRRYHFWLPGGGYDRNLDREGTIWSSVEYLHNNPVRRGLTSLATQWKWSSARWYAGLDDVPLKMDQVEL